MKHARLLTPSERKAEAVKAKLRSEIKDDTSSSDSASDSDGSPKNKKKKKKTPANEAQEAHKQMCEKAMTTMDAVQNIISKLDEKLKKK